MNEPDRDFAFEAYVDQLSLRQMLGITVLVVIGVLWTLVELSFSPQPKEPHGQP